jgi:hypothetical protein
MRKYAKYGLIAFLFVAMVGFLLAPGWVESSIRGGMFRIVGGAGGYFTRLMVPAGSSLNGDNLTIPAGFGAPDNSTVQGPRLGGTGQNSSSWTGVPYVDGGVWADDNQTKARRLMGLPLMGTFTNTKWCSFATVGGLSCTENAPSAGVPTAITVADTAAETSYVALWESATGDLGPKSDEGILYDATTGNFKPTTITTHVSTTYLADANATLTYAQMRFGAKFNTYAFTKSTNVVILPACAALGDEGAEGTFMIGSAYYLTLRAPGDVAFKTTGCTTMQNLYSTNTEGDFYKVVCEKSAAATWVWRMYGQLGNWTCVAR